MNKLRIHMRRSTSICRGEADCCVAHVLVLVLGVILNTGCVSIFDRPASKNLDKAEKENFYYEHFIDVYVRENEGATRGDAEKHIYNTFLKNTKPAIDVLKGSVDKIIIEKYVGSIHYQKVAEIDGDTDEAKSILAALYESSATIGKTPSHYNLIIYFREQNQPMHVYLQGGLFEIRNEGMYWSERNLEHFIGTLVGKSLTAEAGNGSETSND